MDYRAIVNRVLGKPEQTGCPEAIQPVAVCPKPDAPAPQPHVATQAGSKEVSCDQAVFTSIRSPMGEGYRVVATSAGVRPQEKAEITRHSPSHGGLIDGSPEGTGLLAYPLSSGRYCVCHCLHAGAEHTARGGLRVWTQAALLDAEAFRAFGWNPMRVHRVLRTATQADPSISTTSKLAPLRLSPGFESTTPAPMFNAEGAESFARVVSALLQGGRWVISSNRPPRTTLEWAIEMIPCEVRSRLAISAGITFSLVRRLNVVWIDQDKQGVSHLIRGHDIRWCDLAASRPPETSSFDAWLGLVRDRAVKGRLQGIARMTSRIAGRAEPAMLRRLALLCNDIDLAHRGEEETNAKLRIKYSSFKPDGELERELIEKLLETVRPRETTE